MPIAALEIAVIFCYKIRTGLRLQLIDSAGKIADMLASDGAIEKGMTGECSIDKYKLYVSPVSLVKAALLKNKLPFQDAVIKGCSFIEIVDDNAAIENRAQSPRSVQLMTALRGLKKGDSLFLLKFRRGATENNCFIASPKAQYTPEEFERLSQASAAAASSSNQAASSSSNTQTIKSIATSAALITEGNRNLLLKQGSSKELKVVFDAAQLAGIVSSDKLKENGIFSRCSIGSYRLEISPLELDSKAIVSTIIPKIGRRLPKNARIIKCSSMGIIDSNQTPNGIMLSTEGVQLLEKLNASYAKTGDIFFYVEYEARKNRHVAFMKSDN